VLALTAHNEPAARERLLAAGMSGHIPKPIEPDGLQRALARWLSSPEPDAAS